MLEPLKGCNVGRYSSRPGDYWKESTGVWYGVAPNGLTCNLALHVVTEHDDGTITASPSIRVSNRSESWHGYLEAGRWRTAAD